MRNRGLFFVIGGVAGVLVVRGFFLDTLEEIGWRLFWEGIKRGEIMNLDTVLQSATFAKSLVGFLIGGFLGICIGQKMRKPVSSRGNLDGEKESEKDD